MMIPLLFASCVDDNGSSNANNSEPEVYEVVQNTILVYMSGENDLNDFVSEDLAEMREASKHLPEGCRVVVYLDKAGTDSLPQVVRLEDGKQIPDDKYVCQKDQLSSDPRVMGQFLRWATTRYPAMNYGLVLWGHASGWIIEKDSVATTRSSIRKAYGRDSGNNTKSERQGVWMNIPSLAATLSENLPKKLKFIFADCCNFQCVENAYELRNVTEYLIGSPAEIPGEGAPYQQILMDLTDPTDSFYIKAVDHYHDVYDRNNRHVPLSVVKTSELQQLAMATAQLLEGMIPMKQFNMAGLIYYTGAELQRICYDMNDVLLYNSGTDSVAYIKWKEALDRAVVYRRSSKFWMTNGHVFFDFNVTEQRYGGISMFFAKESYDKNGLTYNEDIKKMQWYWAVGSNLYYN